MTQDKWDNIKDNIQEKFEVEDKGNIHLDEHGGVDIEYIVFVGPLGRMRLEFIVRPILLDKKTIYARRIGAETKIDYVYSQTEKSHKLVVYKWDDDRDDWIEMEDSMFK